LTHIGYVLQISQLTVNNLPESGHICSFIIMASTVVASGDLPITVKCAFNGQPRRFKISLRDVLVGSLENKVSSLSLLEV
jgi:hypothetical protein